MQQIWSHCHRLSTPRNLLQKPRQLTHKPPKKWPCHIWVWDTTVQTETGEASPDHSLTTKDITAQAIMIHIEATLGHYVGTDTTTTGVANDDLTQSTETTATTIDLATVTHHINHIIVLHNIRNSSGYRDQSRLHSWPSYRSSRHESHRSSSWSSRMKKKSYPKKNMKVKIDNPHTDYYSFRWSL